MNLRQEQVVLIGTLALLGLLGWSSFKTPTRMRSSRPKGGKVDVERHVAPDPRLALPAPRKLEQLDRDVFSRPSDTRPLPPLDLTEPPLEPLWGTRPLAGFDMTPTAFAGLLRAEAKPTLVLKLFEAPDEFAPEEAAPIDAAAPKPVLSPEERAQLAESWKKLYDWIRLGDSPPMFGQIRNPDRYALKQRANEAVLFVEVKPETGAERFPGQKPAPYERSRVSEFAFADTPSNFIQQKKRQFVPPIGPRLYAELMEFANTCVTLRTEAREALAVAEEMFQLASRTEPDDPAPQFGLGQCFEAGFQFEKAFELYQELVEKYPHRAETHVMLGQLEARFRMFESAEERMRHAVAKDGRSSWIVQLAFGRLLMQRQRFDEALVHLEEAFRYEPSEPALAHVRARIRTELGAAQIALGRIEDARSSFEKALQAAPDEERALAGKLAAAYLARQAAGADSAAKSEQGGFDVVLSRALLDLEAKSWFAARDGLQLAAEADPLRAARALAALSWLAEVTGYAEEALRFVEQAIEADPTDAWIVHQHGRLLAARGDAEGARAAFVTALDLELGFTDAMLALAELSRTGGAHADAERYFARVLATTREGKPDNARRAEILARRGLNLLDLGNQAAAGSVFDEALGLDALHPLARVGQAWCTYLGGDTQKAIQQLAELKDVRNAKGESDPFVVFAGEQIKRVQEHENKTLWTDRFERRRLMNNWDVEEAVGPTIALEDGAATITGNFSTGGRTLLFRSYAGPDFVSIEMDITVKSSGNAKVALFVSKERRLSASQSQTQGAVAIGRRRDGGLVVLAMDTATADENWEDVPDLDGRPWWPTDRPVRVRIEFAGDGSDRTARLAIDGLGVRDRIRVPRLSASTNDLRVGVFVESQTGLKADVVVDNVEAVYRLRR